MNHCVICEKETTYQINDVPICKPCRVDVRTERDIIKERYPKRISSLIVKEICKEHKGLRE